jgi:AcrR family transcriptional regulator
MSEADPLLADAPVERVRMRKVDRRAAVLAEAITIIGEQGYQAFSINELARRCGLTTAGLLHHFGSKEGLLIALLEERDRINTQAVAARLVGLRRGQALSREQVLKVLHAIVRQNSNQPHLIRFFAILRAEALVSDHPAARYFYDRDLAARAVFGEIVASHVEDPAATAQQIQATMYGLEVQWLREDCGFDLVAAWDQVAVKLLQ